MRAGHHLAEAEAGPEAHADPGAAALVARGLAHRLELLDARDVEPRRLRRLGLRRHVRDPADPAHRLLVEARPLDAEVRHLEAERPKSRASRSWTPAAISSRFASISA